MKFIAITNDAKRARVYQDAGVDRIMVDLEINGKEARQGHLNTLISRHEPADVSTLRPIMTTSELMVRTNPIFDGSASEIDDVIARGADRLMLPMFRHPDEVRRFLDLIDGRAHATLLVETAAAFARLPQILDVDGTFDIHIGLNDLHLEYKLDFMFELFTSGLLDHAAQQCATRNVAFGIGGIARVGQGLVPAEMVAAEHIRLGSTRVILSRDFSDITLDDDQRVAEIELLRQAFQGRKLGGKSVPAPSFSNAVMQVAELKRSKAGERSEP